MPDQHSPAGRRGLPVAPPVVDGAPTPPELNAVIHPIHRLRICALLEPVTEEEFSVIRDLVGVSDSVLSKHVSALKEAGFLSQRGGTRNGRRRVYLSLTPAGWVAFSRHVAALREIAEGAGNSTSR